MSSRSRRPDQLRVAIASGKGGTGKTTLATALAVTAACEGRGPLTLADCDVEQPNAWLFFELRPGEEPRSQPVYVPSPDIDAALCVGCHKCAQLCRFNALAVVRDEPLWFAQLCHGCGACWLSCEHGAIRRGKRQIGTTTQAATQHPGLRLVWGELIPGQPLAPPVIKAVKELAAARQGLTILDAPPGTSCPLVETLRDTDICLLVTEPTPFGLHDLRLAVEVTKVLGMPAALVINRAGIGDARPLTRYAASEGLEVLLEVPFSRRAAAILARGGSLLDVGSEWQGRLARLWRELFRLADGVQPSTARVAGGERV